MQHTKTLLAAILFMISTAVRSQELSLVGTIELRNYTINPGQRDRFTRFFTDSLILPQKELGGSILGTYHIKGEEDHFLWIRGFKDMNARSRFLPSFYYGSPAWKKYNRTANSMIANSDNVYLLRPLVFQENKLVRGGGIDPGKLHGGSGLAIIAFYIANTRLPQLLDFFASDYLPLLEKAGFPESTLWVSELMENDFPALPVFQDKNLLVTITFYKDEKEYGELQQRLETAMPASIRSRFRDIVTTTSMIVAYPTEKPL